MSERRRVVVPKVMGPPGAVEVNAAPRPQHMPVLVTDEVVLFPGMMAPLVVSREADKAAIDEALVKFRVVLALARVPGAEEEEQPPSPEHLYRFGCVCSVMKKLSVPDGSLRVLLQGVSRARARRWVHKQPYLLAEVETIDEPEDPREDAEFSALTRHLRSQFERVVELSELPQEAWVTALNIEQTGRLCDVITANIELSVSVRQAMLEAVDVRERLKKVSTLVGGELEVLELRERIRREARNEMERGQRQYYLRQQMDAIRKELGEDGGPERELEELANSIAEAGMPDEAREQAEREHRRLGQMSPSSAEYSVARTYLDWLLRYPWSRFTEDHIDLAQARAVLDADHYDLEAVKERILEYLAVLLLNPGQRGPILCFAGPPGTGKTSLGMSIARAIGRKFARVSLGGMRDEAEIRGHRRTYIGALPGRIVQGLCQAGSANPVFMLDEIDKLGMDFRGDPASALLEVLDPAQNKAFRDHYLDVDVDLSRVMFITTANVLDSIPLPLQDRMEVLSLSGYTLPEKLEISRRHLIPRQLEAHGLEKSSLRFRKDGLSELIAGYTREAGVRNLERRIAEVCRKRARRLVEGDLAPMTIGAEGLDDLLGPRQFFSETVSRRRTPGLVAGLAWTSTGGDVLFVEAAAVRPGTGLTLTGSLGEVMKESAQAALTCVRTRSAELGIAPDAFRETEIHIHVPAGAIPKDGPSAGVTIAVALASLATGRAARHDLAMTGEITLQGRVLRIGGVKEKVLGAARAGVRTVILPRENEGDLREVPEATRKGMGFDLVDTDDEAIRAALLPPVVDRRARRNGK